MGQESETTDNRHRNKMVNKSQLQHYYLVSEDTDPRLHCFNTSQRQQPPKTKKQVARAAVQYPVHKILK